MKVLFIHDFENKIGGAVNYIEEVRSSLEDRGHETQLLTTVEGESSLGFDESGVRSYVQKFWSPNKRERLEEMIKDFQPDLIHVNNIHKGTIPVMKALESVGVPVVKTFHDFAFFCICPHAVHGDELCDGKPRECLVSHEVSLKQYLFRKPLHALRVRKLQAFDQVLVPSSDLQSVVGRFADVQVLPNFVDTKRFRPGGYGGDGVLFVGEVAENKGIEVLVDALSDTDISGKVVGKGEVEKYSEISERRNADLNFKGYVEPEELIRIYQKSEITVIPSVWRESFNLVGLESLACGTPVVASDQGGMQEYVEEGRNGYLFERGNPRDLLAKIRQVRDEDLGSDEFLADDIFRKENHMSKLESIYEEM